MINVAIDGPAGAGKSTIARRAAEKFFEIEKIGLRTLKTA